MNLYQKMLCIMQDVQYLAKDDKVEFGNTKYKALSEEKVTRIMREELIKHKMLIFPIQQTATRTGQITHVDVTYRLQNAENDEEYIDIVSCGDGADSQDKGSGKAMTYAFKYMWLRTFAIPTGEDPDKISSDELDAQMHQENNMAKDVEAACASQKSSPLICRECGKEIKAIRNGETKYLPIEVARLMDGMCYQCGVSHGIRI